MNNPLISVIVPIYNVENYLDRCVESIVGQTYSNLEIILVDDGSPDSCPAKCDEWAKRDSRIKVIHKENGGVSNSRNVGMKSATGDYIAFVDGDDFIHREMYEKLLQSIKQNNSDMSVCGFSYYYDNTGEIKDVHEKNLKAFESGDPYTYILKVGHKDMGDYVATDNIMGSACRCLYSRNILRDVSFHEELFIAEDLIFLLDLLKKDIKISVVEDCLYYYVQRNSSAIHSMSQRKIDNRLLSNKILLEKFREVANVDELDAYKFHLYCHIVNDLLSHGQKKKAKELIKTDFMKSLYSRHNYILAKKNTTLKSYKFAYFLAYHKLISLYSFLLRLKK